MNQQLHIIIAISILIGSSGCTLIKEKSPPTPPVWEQAQLSELAPVGETLNMQGTRLKTTNLTAHIFDVPADKLPQLSSLWTVLDLHGIRFGSHHAFRANAFRIGRADMSKWEWIHLSLGQTNAVKSASCSLWLSEGLPSDLPIRNIPRRQPLFFTTAKAKAKKITVGPGKLVLRLKDDQDVFQTNVCHLTVYPAFALHTTSSIPQLAQEAKKQEIAFLSAGFKINMKPNELVVLGPEEYYGDDSTLGGLFFANKEGNLFTPHGPHPSTQIKQAVRIIVLICTATRQDS